MVVDVWFSISGKTTVNSLYGTRVAVLAGDFLFAQASWGLANLENIEVSTCGIFAIPTAIVLRNQLSISWYG